MPLVVMIAGLIGISSLGPPASAATCQPTRPDSLGPFYVANAPRRSKVGTGHVLTGVVRKTKICTPLAGARIEFWLASPSGTYDAAHRATVFSRRNGTYRFESNSPPGYGGRPPHVHIRVSARGFAALVTQYYPRKGQTKGRLDLVLSLPG